MFISSFQLAPLVPLLLAIINTILAASETHPPSITTQPRPIVYFKEEEGGEEDVVELPCIAEGKPKPEYKWTKNGEEFDVTQYDYIDQVKGLGTLVIHRPSDADQGYYQCFAYNSHGSTSVSIKAFLTRASQGTFPRAEESKKLRPMIGSSITLKCEPPVSTPAATVIWATTAAGSQDGSDSLEMINYDDRVTKDLDGNLHLTNVMAKDSMDGKAYICMARNNFLRSMVQGGDQLIFPQETQDSDKRVPVDVMWASLTDTLGLKEDTVRLKCIFSGNPTPDVSWERIGGDLHKYRMLVESYGQELVIKNLQFEDAGQYVCKGQNDASMKVITRKFNIRVQAKPYWIDEPKDHIMGVEEDVAFLCNAGGVPAPSVEWFINGQKIADAPKNERRLAYTKRVEYRNLTKADAQVIQCNASNIHGYIWADVFLNVLATPPEVIEPPLEWQRVAQGQQANISCQTTGKPDPVITWFKEDQVLEGDRYTITELGTLEIKETQMTDSGLYRCEARNKFGLAKAEGEIVVRIKTEIVNVPPAERETDAGHDIIMRCDSKTDPHELNNLKIEWLLDNKPLDTSQSRFVVSQANFSLTIRGVKTKDTGRYSCNVSNGLDNDLATTRLIVRSVPDPPQEVSVVACNQRSAQIKWDNASDNNSPIEKYIVEYNTTFDEELWRFGAEVGASKTKAKIKLSPWANYTFRVIARNGKGNSEPSEISTICRTDPALPDKNPENVHTIRDERGKLKIRWDEMPPLDHNGPGFEYVVIVKKKNDPTAEIRTYNFSDYKQTSLDIETGDTYEPYEIEVRARNNRGEALAPVQVITGYSGEDRPLAYISDFELDESKPILPNQASFKWTGVDNDPQIIRGKFSGYKIQFWETGDREGTEKEVDVPREETKFSRSRRQAKQEEHTITNLPPFTNLTLQVVVANTYFVGPDSNQVFHETPEGVPSAVTSLRASVRGSNHFILNWGEPEHKNGILTGYDIAFKEVTSSNVGEEIPLEPQINDPEQRHVELSGLADNQDYRVFIWARTRQGRGKQYYIDVRTANAELPAEPGFEFTMIGPDMLNISWGQDQDSDKPAGFYHHVKYRKSGDSEWDSTPMLSGGQNWQNLSSLEPGAQYEVKVIASNSLGDTESDSKYVTTLAEGQPSRIDIATAGWFIAMMVIIAILILILIIVCIIKRNRGDKYHVQEKERLRGRDPENGDQDHFNEYSQLGDDNSLGKDGSLIGPEKPPMESDTDSMEEYAGVDPSKFNEDGSFIGQYGTKSQSDKPSMSTFV